MCKNVQKHASQVLIYQKTCISRSHLPKNVQKRAKTCKNVQKRAKTCKNVQKRASQMFLDPIQKRALSRSVHLEAVYLEALLYKQNQCLFCSYCTLIHRIQQAQKDQYFCRTHQC